MMNTALRLLNRLGRRTVTAVDAVGYAAGLLGESLAFVVAGRRRGQPVRLAAVVEQMRQVGADAIPIVLLLVRRKRTLDLEAFSDLKG